MMMELYTGPWPFDEFDKSAPASVRLRNIGAIGASRKAHEKRFGAVSAQELPASDGSKLPTPCFPHVYGGAAYWGHFVIRRASKTLGTTSIKAIMEAYATGNSTEYETAVSKDTKLAKKERIDVLNDPEGYLKLYRIMIAMGRWEAGARSKGGPGYDAFEAVYDLSDPRVQGELWHGMVHGCREAFRDQGLRITPTPEELTYTPPPKAPVEPPQRPFWKALGAVLRGLIEQTQGAKR